MNARSNILLCIALIAGTFLAFCTKKILNSIPEKEEAAAAAVKMVPVLVAKQDIHIGDELTPQNIRFDRLAEDEVPSEVINTFRDAKGRIAKKELTRGNLISIFDLNDPDETKKRGEDYTPLNSSYVSFTIETVTENGEPLDSSSLGILKGKITPDVDKADFVLTYEKKDAEHPERIHQRVSSSETILSGVVVRNARVVAESEENQNSFLELSFLIDNNSLTRLEEACRIGRVTIAVNQLRSSEIKSEKPSILNPALSGLPVKTRVFFPAEASSDPEAETAETADSDEIILEDPSAKADTQVPVLLENLIPGSEDKSGTAEEEDPVQPSEPPKMSVPRKRSSEPGAPADTRPRVSIPRPSSEP